MKIDFQNRKTDLRIFTFFPFSPFPINFSFNYHSGHKYTNVPQSFDIFISDAERSQKSKDEPES